MSIFNKGLKYFDGIEGICYILYFLFFCNSEYKSVEPNAIALPFNYPETVIFYYLYRSNFRLASLLRTEDSLIS